MVLTGREWPVSTGRAARGDRALYRLLLLSGILAVAWLAGMGVAHGETHPGGLADRILGSQGVAGEVGRSAGEDVRDTGAAARAATGALTGAVAPRTAEFSETVLNGTGVLEDGSAGRVVQGTADGAGRLVGSVASTGREVMGSADRALRESDLMDGVSGLAGSTGALGALDETVAVAIPADPSTADGLGTRAAAVGPAGDRASDSGAEDTQTSEPSEPTERPGPAFGLLAPAGGTHSVPAGTGTDAADTADTDTDDRIRLITGGSPGSSGADATGASAPSFPTPGAAGFLTPRADHLAPRAQRVALPGDPTLVVRDVADDPSFSPD